MSLNLTGGFSITGGLSVDIEIGDTTVFSGGDSTGSLFLTTMDQITVSTTGNATSFGALTVGRLDGIGVGNGPLGRGVSGGGFTTVLVPQNILDFIIINTPAAATDYGDLITSRFSLASVDNSVTDRGVFTHGSTAAETNVMEYITISTNGNAVDFGDGTAAGNDLWGCSNGDNDRGVLGGGQQAAAVTNVMQYITISTIGNAADFGDLTLARFQISATSNLRADTGIFIGGFGTSRSNIIDWITISTLGNAADFGDLLDTVFSLAAGSNGLGDRGVSAGGMATTNHVNVMEHITISTKTGNSTDFGDLTVGRRSLWTMDNAI